MASPSAREIEKEFGVSATTAAEIEQLLANSAARGGRDSTNALEEVGMLLGWDPSVRTLRLEITHPDNYDAVYASEVCGEYLDPESRGDATFMWLDGKYLACERGRLPGTDTWGPKPREHGFYITSEDDERQSFEEHFEECYLKTERDRRDYWQWIGPRDEDLWTDDFVRFHSWREGGYNRGDKPSYTLNLRRDDGYESDWLAKPRPEVSYEGDLDDPEAFYDEHKDAYWRLFYKWQNTEGYYGSVWYIPKTGRYRDEPRLLDPPKNLAWQMAEEWRKEFRVRYGVRKALTKPVPSLTPAAVGISPQDGDLVSDNFHGYLPFGVTIYFVTSYWSNEFERQMMTGGPGALVVTQREIEDGSAWGRVLGFIAGESRRQQRPVQLWQQPYGWLSDPASWNLVPTFGGAASPFPPPRGSMHVTASAATPQGSASAAWVGPVPQTWIRGPKGGLGGLSRIAGRRKRGRARRVR